MKNVKNQLLLIEDVDGLGRSGDVVTAKPGFVRNFLLPQRMAVIADKHTLKMREKLQAEREKRAAVDKKEAEALAAKLNGKTFEIEVKVDPDGHMYGSVTANDLVEILSKEGHVVERKNFLLGTPIKVIGEHEINMKLKEDIPASFKLKVNSDIVILKPVVVEEEKPALEEKSQEEEKTEE